MTTGTRTKSLHSDFEHAFRPRVGQVLSRAEIRAILQDTFGDFPIGSVVPTDHAEPSSEHVNQCRKCTNPDYQIFETVLDGQGRQGEARYRVRPFRRTGELGSEIDPSQEGKTMPRFALTSASVRSLSDGQASILYKALCPYPELRRLDELVESCRELGYKVSDPSPSFMWESILWHLRRFKKDGMVREA